MKSLLRLIPLTLLASACASAPAPATVTSPEPTGATPIRVPAVTPTFETVPDRWWMKDVETDGVFGASVDRAYAELLANREPRRTVVVAVIDSGVDVEHEDLDDVLWVNPDEPRNGRDDDGNGYVDDVHGWNFIGGADGSHVADDTYEVTRLYAACQRLYGDMPRDPPPVFRPSQQECPAIEAAFEQERLENAAMLPQIRQMAQMLNRAEQILRAELSDTVTEERVRALRPRNAEVQQAQQMYLQLAQFGATPEVVRNELERMERLEERGLNPTFDPRPIVGDDFANPNERVYGNSDVAGPDPAHGTGVAAIIAAERNNNLGTDGIAPAVRIMVIRAVPDGDERDKDVANAILYAVDNGAHIINMSFGKAWSPRKEVVDAAVRHADERGVLMVHAAGNDAKDLATENNFPNRTYLSGGSATHWIEVGASNWRGREQLASEFSNYGAGQVDVFAPGSDVMSAAPGNEYRAASGTSFAAPVVSGVAAVLMSYYPELSARQVREIILETTTPMGEQMVTRPGAQSPVRFGELSVTGGIVNLYRAVQRAEQLTRPRT